MNSELLQKLNHMQGAPLLCVPLVAPDADSLLRDAAAAGRAGADMVEWRGDLFSGPLLPGALPPLLAGLKKALDGLPLLFTHRSKSEGGRGVLTTGEYTALCEAAAASGNIDLLDIEFCRGAAAASALASFAAGHGVARVVSHHYFSHTPSKDAMLRELLAMRAAGADVPKLAVMPAAPEDVTALLDATAAYTRANGPAITMAMGRRGAFSRVAGGFFGSRVTFASLTAASAPGQIGIGAMRQMLDEFYCESDV